MQPSNAISSALRALAIVVTLGVTINAALAADAPDTSTREQLEQAAQEVAELSVSISDEIGSEVRSFAHHGSRPMLGIGIDGREGHCA